MLYFYHCKIFKNGESFGDFSGSFEANPRITTNEDFEKAVAFINEKVLTRLRETFSYSEEFLSDFRFILTALNPL